MMKHKMMTCLAVTAIATAALGIPAFAAEAKQEIYTVTVKEADGRETDMNMTLPDLEIMEMGSSTMILKMGARFPLCAGR